MHARRTRLSLAAAAAALAAAGFSAPALTSSASAYDPAPQSATSQKAQQAELRFATFNASLNRLTAGDLVRDLSTPDNAQAAAIAETIQRVNPDVLLVNEFDYVEGGRAAELFRDNYLEVAHHGVAPVDYPYYYVAPANTGVATGFDLNNNGVVGAPGTPAGGDDSFGFGHFPGQYGMVVYSKYPIATDEVRTFQHFLWKDMPGALLPDDPATPAESDWYSPAELDVFRLSSKSHWDVPIKVPGRKPVHFLVSHPTPPTFDGTEDRNGTRNHDEIRFWADYVAGGRGAAYIYDDAGETGGLGRGQDFVIAGDQNADPYDGDSTDRAIWQLLDHPRIQDPHPTSTGAVEAAERDGGENVPQIGPDAEDTADFADALQTKPTDQKNPGNLRADYVLPSERFDILGSGVFWLPSSDPLFTRLVGVYPFPTSDHRMVWLDVR
ncbi:endonuclease/exonuclease/phosphatase family protein [Nocardioides zhouii]|uniref:Endonuclease/exonuclease/phosphatase family protein n=1 Tax=Nocardioides zhouii TaxID=1168729 RepID=A0A4Q2SDB7_9ACTN|nr:endonuclease/exonuclease/phosphatase family protein [Nocardioides zhouii]RYC03315.1 endonuclease/exonuclease/phosphatase family protein [Nocardioides zhouii]